MGAIPGGNFVPVLKYFTGRYLHALSCDHTDRFTPGRIIRHIFKIEPVEMRKPAVPAPHRDTTAADREIVEPGNPAVPARCLYGQGPDRPGTGSGKLPGFVHILNTGHENPGRPTGFAGDIGPVGHRPDKLVCHLPAMVAIGAVVRADKPVVHE